MQCPVFLTCLSGRYRQSPFHLAPRPLPLGNPLPLAPPRGPLVPLPAVAPPLTLGILLLLVVVVVAVPGVVGGAMLFLLGVALILALLMLVVSPIIVSPSPLPPATSVDASSPSFIRCCFCHRLIESISGACRSIPSAAIIHHVCVRWCICLLQENQRQTHSYSSHRETLQSSRRTD